MNPPPGDLEKTASEIAPNIEGTPQASRGRAAWKRTLRLARWSGLLWGPPLAYFLFAFLLGAIPTNSDWRPDEEGPSIYVASNGVHVDLVLPVEAGGRDYRKLLPLSTGSGWERGARWVAFGWGERHFYLETPGWSDLTAKTAIRALLLPTGTLMHVSFLYGALEENERCVRLDISEEELIKLANYVESRFARDASGEFIVIPERGYKHYDDFYEARGSYHLFQTCNDWANQGLAESGLPAALWSPLDGAILRQARRALEREAR